MTDTTKVQDAIEYRERQKLTKEIEQLWTIFHSGARPRHIKVEGTTTTGGKVEVKLDVYDMLKVLERDWIAFMLPTRTEQAIENLLNSFDELISLKQQVEEVEHAQQR